jgi:hypothetical protein
MDDHLTSLLRRALEGDEEVLRELSVNLIQKGYGRSVEVDYPMLVGQLSEALVGSLRSELYGIVRSEVETLAREEDGPFHREEEVEWDYEETLLSLPLSPLPIEAFPSFPEKLEADRQYGSNSYYGSQSDSEIPGPEDTPGQLHYFSWSRPDNVYNVKMHCTLTGTPAYIALCQVDPFYLLWEDTFYVNEEGLPPTEGQVVTLVSSSFSPGGPEHFVLIVKDKRPWIRALHLSFHYSQ